MEYILFLVGGLLGSAHCVGMCGGFVIALGAMGGKPGAILMRQILYGLGRVFTYTFGGVAAGYVGLRLSGYLPGAIQAQAWLCVVAGVLLIIQGLHAAGWLRFSFQRPPSACPGPTMFGALLKETRRSSVFIAGIINGLLPCGLVYAYLALAASQGTLVSAGLTMLSFGLGTLPVLALVGTGSGYVSHAFRRRVLTLAAWCVVLTGLLTLWRGYEFWQVAQSPVDDGVSCPMCRETAPPG
jgi:sulfite exporter TauE/SafE